jgi:hypothetical protein
MFSQITTAAIADNTTYRLDVFVGHRLDFPFPSPGGTFGLTHNGTAIPGATANILDPGVGIWLNEFISFTTTTGAGDPFQGQLLGIFLRDGGASGQINFDNVRLSATPTATGVPEPASLALLGIGLAAFGAARRRRKA